MPVGASSALGAFSPFPGGALFDSRNLVTPTGPLPLSCGEVTSLAGGPDGHLTVATESGEVIVFALAPGWRS